MTDRIDMGTYVIKCPKCGGEKFSYAEDFKDKPESPVTCLDCGNVATFEAIKQHGLESAQQFAAGAIRTIFNRRR